MCPSASLNMSLVYIEHTTERTYWPVLRKGYCVELYSGKDLMAEILELEVQIEFSLPEARAIAH